MKKVLAIAFVLFLFAFVTSSASAPRQMALNIGADRVNSHGRFRGLVKYRFRGNTQFEYFVNPMMASHRKNSATTHLER